MLELMKGLWLKYRIKRAWWLAKKGKDAEEIAKKAHIPYALAKHIVLLAKQGRRGEEVFRQILSNSKW